MVNLKLYLAGSEYFMPERLLKKSIKKIKLAD
jgi:hypothetical protein